MNSSSFFKIFRICLVLMLIAVSVDYVNAQRSRQVQCGDIIQGEFQEAYQYIYYSLYLEPGDLFFVSGESIGDYLEYQFELTTPGGGVLYGSNVGMWWFKSPYAETGVKSQSFCKNRAA